MSAAAVPPAKITVEEFLLRPERADGLGEELLEGGIHLVPNAKLLHNDLVRLLERKLQLLESRGFIVFSEVACRLGQDSLPNTDIAVFRRERWNSFDKNAFAPEAPSLAVEVHSPSNRDILRKKAVLYLEGGAEQVWLVYPQTRRISVWYADDRIEEARLGESLQFEGLTIGVSEIFE